MGLVAILVRPAQVEGSIVTNGNFETGNLNGWTTEGWTWSSDASISTVVMFDVYGGDGASYAFQANPTHAPMGTIGHLKQWLQLEGGTTYVVSWEQGMQNIGPPLNTAGRIEVRLGGQLLSGWSQGVLGTDGQTGLNETKVFTPAKTEAYELGFRFVRNAGSYGDSTVYMYVDNICVNVPNAYVIPEPASVAVWSLLAVAGIGFGWRRRRW